MQPCVFQLFVCAHGSRESRRLTRRWSSRTAPCFQCCCRCFIVNQNSFFVVNYVGISLFFIPPYWTRIRSLCHVFVCFVVFFCKVNLKAVEKTITTTNPSVTCIKVEPLLGSDPPPTGRMSWPLEVYFRRGLIFCLIIRLSSACAVVSWEARGKGSHCTSGARKYIRK